jgi:hypothetical protein
MHATFLSPGRGGRQRSVCRAPMALNRRQQGRACDSARADHATSPCSGASPDRRHHGHRHNLHHQGSYLNWTSGQIGRSGTQQPPRARSQRLASAPHLRCSINSLGHGLCRRRTRDPGANCRRCSRCSIFTRTSVTACLRWLFRCITSGKRAISLRGGAGIDPALATFDHPEKRPLVGGSGKRAGEYFMRRPPRGPATIRAH